MTGVAVILAVAAVLLAVPARRRTLGPARARVASARTRDWPVMACGVLVVAVIWLLAGRQVAVVITAVVLVGSTAARVLWARQRTRRRRRAAGEVARACTVLAAEMELGKIPVTALLVTAEDCPVLKSAAAAAGIGGDVVPIWMGQAAQPGHGGLTILARAWRVAAVTGAPLAASVEMVATALRADDEVDQLVAGELAAPRLTGVILALLPVAGLVLGYLIGADPVTFLLTTPWGWGCLLSGTLLACCGLLWTEHLAAQEAATAP